MTNNKLAEHFADLVDQDGVIERRAIGQPGTSRGYLLCILPRSGSTFLTHLLKDNVHYGYPNEWFNYDSIKSELDPYKISEFARYLDHIWKAYSSSEGLFGLQLSYPQFNYLREIIPLEGVLGQGFRWFYLARENIVLQAISLYIAHQTNVYHRYIFDKESEDIPDVIYNEDEIRKLIDYIVILEGEFERLFQARGIEPIRLTYEGMMENKKKTMMLFRNILGVGHEVIVDDTAAVKKLNNEINKEFEERFCISNKQYLEEILQKRILP